MVPEGTGHVRIQPDRQVMALGLKGGKESAALSKTSTTFKRAFKTSRLIEVMSPHLDVWFWRCYRAREDPAEGDDREELPVHLRSRCRLRVSGFGFRVLGFGFPVSGFRIRDSGFMFHVSCFGFQVSGFRFRVSGFRFRFSGFGFQVSGSGGFRVRVSGSGV